MPSRARRVRGDVFNVDRTDTDTDRPAEPAKPALAGLLTRVSDTPAEPSAARTVIPAPTSPAAPAPRALEPVSAAPEPAPSAAVRPTVAPTAPSRPRGKGGRPPAAEEAQGSEAAITPVPARVPPGLYAAAVPLVKGANCPSWGQLVAWTCEDKPDGVKAAVATLTAAAGRPRRVRGQNRAGTASMLVTARLTAEELALVETLREQLASDLDREVTRTMIVLGALTAATTEDPQP